MLPFKSNGKKKPSSPSENPNVKSGTMKWVGIFTKGQTVWKKKKLKRRFLNMKSTEFINGEPSSKSKFKSVSP